MFIVGLDPGETLGIAYLRFERKSLFLVHHGQIKLPMTKKEHFDWGKLVGLISNQLTIFEGPRVVAIEDYRVYRHLARMHSGKRVLTSILLGCICTIAAQENLPVELYPAISKGRWPDARLKARFPPYFDAEKPHAADAVKIALLSAEKKGAFK